MSQLNGIGLVRVHKENAHKKNSNPTRNSFPDIMAEENFCQYRFRSTFYEGVTNYNKIYIERERERKENHLYKVAPPTYRFPILENLQAENLL